MQLKPMCVIVLSLLVAACGAKQSNAAAHQAAESLLNTRQLMLGMVEPTSNAVFAAQGEPPTDDAGWERVEANALVLAEAGVLLTQTVRRVDDGEWLTHAHELTDRAKAAATAAHAHDADKFGAVADEVYTTCESCHTKYLPKKN